MFDAADVTPPATVAVAAAAVIDERWAEKTVAPPAARVALVDPRVARGVASVVAERPAPESAPNRQPGLQPVVYGTDAAAVEKFAKGFSEARRPACLSPATGGLGVFAIPVIAVQALWGKCSMP